MPAAGCRWYPRRPVSQLAATSMVDEHACRGLAAALGLPLHTCWAEAAGASDATERLFGDWPAEASRASALAACHHGCLLVRSTDV